MIHGYSDMYCYISIVRSPSNHRINSTVIILTLFLTNSARGQPLCYCILTSSDLTSPALNIEWQMRSLLLRVTFILCHLVHFGV